MVNIAELQSDLYSEVPRHNYTVRIGHEYTYVPDVSRRLAALDTIKLSATSPWSHDMKPFVLLLVEYIRRARRPNMGRMAEASQLHKAFSLHKLEDDFGRRSRARSTLHRLRSERLFRYPLPELDLKYALEILLDPNLSTIQDYIRSDETFPGLRRANLSLANLRYAPLSGFNLSQAQMYGADLFKADLSGANFIAGKLAAAELAYANLRNANLHGVDFTLGALRNASLDGTRLSNSIFDYAYLGEASLIDSDFTDRPSEGHIYFYNEGTSMTNANLSGANFSGAVGLTREIIADSFGCCGTKLPSEFGEWRPRHWYPDTLSTHRRRAVIHHEWLAHRNISKLPPWVHGDVEGLWPKPVSVRPDRPRSRASL